MSAVPGASEVREEDAFDVARVAAWLREHAATPEGLDGEPEVRQFTGGASNLTYLLRFPSGRDLIVRRYLIHRRGLADWHPVGAYADPRGRPPVELAIPGAVPALDGLLLAPWPQP